MNENVIAGATKAIGNLCQSLLGSHPKIATSILLPIICRNIHIELDSGASSISSSSPNTSTNSTTLPWGFATMSDCTLHWNQYLLAKLLDQCDGKVLDDSMRETVFKTVSRSLDLCKSYRGYKWASKVIDTLTKSLGSVYLVEFQCFESYLMKDEEFMRNSHLKWGVPPGKFDKQASKWHIPTRHELDFAKKFLEYCANLSMKSIESLILNSEFQNHPKQLGNEFCKWLTILYSVISGLNYLVGEDFTKYVRPNTYPHEFILEPLFMDTGLAFNDSSIEADQLRELRFSIGQMLNRASILFKNHRSDDVESIQILCKCMRSFVCEHGGGFSPEHALSQDKSYKQLKAYTRKCIKSTGLIKLESSWKHLPRYTLAKRAYNQLVQRMGYNASQQVGVDDQIRRILATMIHDLTFFSLENAFAEVRKTAQNVLNSTTKSSNVYRHLVYPKILETFLKSDTPESSESSDRMKGGLFLIQRSVFMSHAIKNWETIYKFIQAVLSSYHNDKPSIQKRIRKLIPTYMTKFRLLPINYQIDEEITRIVSDLESGSDYETQVSFAKIRIAEREKNNLMYYNKLVLFYNLDIIFNLAFKNC